MKTPLDDNSKMRRDYLRGQAFNIAQLERAFNSLVSDRGETPQQMMEKIYEIIGLFKEEELACLLLHLAGRTEELKLKKLGYADEEIERALKNARKRLKKSPPKASA